MIYEKDKIRRLIDYKDKITDNDIKNDLEWILEQYNSNYMEIKDVPNGKAYRRLVEPWDYIYDYSCVEFKENVIRGWEANQKAKAQGVNLWTLWHDEETLEEELIQWKKWYLCK